MRYFWLFWVLVLPALCRAEKQPAWDDLQKLLGKPITSNEVVQFVRDNDLRKAAKGDSGSFTAQHQSYSVMFDRDTVSTIVVRASPWPKGYGDADWTPYANALPKELSASDTRSDVESKLGLPIDRGGNRWVSGDLTLWVFFNKQESRIDELYVWRTKDKP